MYRPIRFAGKDIENFFPKLRHEVNQYFEQYGISKKGNAELYIKTFCMLSIYLVPYGFVLSGGLPAWGVLLGFMVMGVGISGIGFSVMHDANHGAYSKYPWLNRLVSYSMDFIGGNSCTWKVQHNIKHHSFTNVFEADEDIEDKVMLRLSPAGKWRKYHRFQHIYAFFLYSLATLSWATTKDFEQLSEYTREGIIQKQGYKPRVEMFKLIVAKAFYFFYLVALPIIAGNAWWLVLIGFLMMHFVAGFFITVVFQLAHVVEGPEHHEFPPTAQMDTTWAIHQLTTTANFAPNNRLISWFVGGLNFQIEHHLFPSISHVHYKKISKIVKRLAQESGLPYHEYRHFRTAVASHIRMLRALGEGKMMIAKEVVA